MFELQKIKWEKFEREFCYMKKTETLLHEVSVYKNKKDIMLLAAYGRFIVGYQMIVEI